jgi:hypothetical protein
VFGSACFAAAAVLLASLLTPSGRRRWSDLFASWRDALPANPALRRSLAWLPVIAVARGLESLSGLPLLNWVYVAFGASTLLAGIAATAAAPPVVPWAPAAAGGTFVPPQAQQQAQAPPPPGGAGVGGINAIARGLFSQRFPALASEALLGTSPVMMTAPGGVQTQGQLYVTPRHVAFHGAFGRNSRAMALADVVDAAVEAPAGAGVGGAAAQMCVLRLSLPEGPLTLAALNMLGGGDTLDIVIATWRSARGGDGGSDAAAAEDA